MNIRKFIGCLIIAFSPVFINNLLAIESSSSWYQSIAKPGFVPPGWVFAPVWTTIYTLTGIALYLFLKAEGSWDKKRKGLVFFTIQIILNACYTPIFFGEQSILGGLVISILLALFVFLTIVEFLKFSKTAGILMIPYISWGIFAVVLSFNIFRLN